jgi:hypothetical protein
MCYIDVLVWKLSRRFIRRLKRGLGWSLPRDGTEYAP